MNRFVYLDLQRLGYDLLTEINKFLGELELFLHSPFKLKDLDPLKYFTFLLGLECEFQLHSLLLHSPTSTFCQ